MSNLKKVLSVGLASTMVMGMVATSAAAATYDKFSDKDEIVNKDAVSMVTELGIIAGLPGGSYGPKQNIDRASFARLVCVALNGGKEPQLGNLKTSFSDTQGNWAEKYIAYCVQQGIIAGKGNNTFAPSANVTGSEAAKMLLVALGYNCAYEGIGGANWQTSTDVLANQAGLYKDLGSMNTSEPLTRDNAAQMIYNTLNATMVKYEMVPGISANGQVTMTTQRVNVTKDVKGTTHNVTLLEDAFDAIKVEGIVVANEYANLESTDAKGSALDEGKTKIDVTNCGSGEEQATFDDGTYAFSSGADVLGKSITLYVKNDSSKTSKATVLGGAILDDDNKVVTNAGQKELSKLASDNDLDLVDGTKVIENFHSAGKWEDYSAASAAARGVSKTLIDNNDDGDVDYVLVNKQYFGQVSKYSTKEDGSITVNTSGKADPALTADDKDDVVGFEDVKKDDYVLASWIGGKLHVEKAESVTGTIDAYKADKGVTSSLTVGDTKYDVSKVGGFTGGSDDIQDPTTFGKNNLDTEGTFYLDNNGMIIAAGNVSENAYNYAYLWDYEAGDTFDDARAKVTLSDGSTKTYTVDKVIGTDGKEIKTEATIKGTKIYNYAINKDGELKLTVPKQLQSEKDNTYSVDKGKTSIGDSKYATNNTVFFYVDLDGTAVNDVDVYTGYKNAPSIDKASGLKGTVVLNSSTSKNVNVLALVGDDVKTTSDDVKNHLYVTDINSEYNDYTLVDAIFAGTDEEKTDVKVDTADLNGKGLYLYTEGKDGVYSLDPVGSNELAVNGPVANISDSTINYNGKEYDLTDKTVLIDLTDDVVAYLGALPTTTDYIVSMLVDDTDNGDLLMIVIDNGNGSLLDPSEKDIEDAFKSEDTVYAAGELPSTVTVPEKKTLVLDGTVTGTTTISGDGTVKLADTTVKGSVTATADTTLAGTIEIADGGKLTVAVGKVGAKGSTATIEVADGAEIVYTYDSGAWKSAEYIDGAFTLDVAKNDSVTYTLSDKVTIKKDLEFVETDTLAFGSKAVVTLGSGVDIKGACKIDAAKGAQIVSAKEGALSHSSLSSINGAGTWTYDGETWTSGK